MAESGDRLRLGLTGWPLQRSLSPLIHSRFLESCGLKGEYGLYPIPPVDFRNDVRNLFEEGVEGLNVTYPHKSAAWDVCGGVVEGYARGMKAVNTLHYREGRITGFNTDVDGFHRFLDTEDHPEPFFIVGSGGAALAVSFALSSAGLPAEVFCRNPGAWRGAYRSREIEELGSAVGGTAGGSVVNATTLGWKDDDPFPLDPRLLRGKCFIDLNYNESWKWRNSLLDVSHRVFTGEAMLVYQAAESFRIWTGMEPDAEAALKWIREVMQSKPWRDL